jgi:hypothetical protein
MPEWNMIIRPYYLVRPRLWGEERLRMIDDRTVVSHRWRYVYVRVPKSANSTVITALFRRFPEPGLDPADLDRAKVRSTHFRNLGVGDLFRIRGYFFFSVVRNPYGRVLSAFLDKFRAGDKHLANYGERVAAHDGGQVSFRAFCRYLADGGEAENAHWMRQSRILGLADRMDHVGRLETLEADLEAIFARIGGAAPDAVPRVGPPATAASKRLAEYYDAECAALVEQVYRDDFTRFGYPTGLA